MKMPAKPKKKFDGDLPANKAKPTKMVKNEFPVAKKVKKNPPHKPGVNGTAKEGANSPKPLTKANESVYEADPNRMPQKRKK